MDEDLGPNLFRRKGSAQIQLRKRVPADVVQAYGKAFVAESLGTSDRREANRRKAARLHALEEEWAALRRAGSSAAPPEIEPVRPPARTIDELTPEQMARLRARVRDDIVAWDDETRRNDLRSRRESDYAGQDSWHTTIMEDATGHGGRRIDTRAADKHAAEALAGLGLKAVPRSKAVANARAAYLEGLRAAMAEIRKRDAEGWDFIDGAVPEVRPAEALPAPRGTLEGPSLDVLRENWERQNSPRDSSRREARTVVRMLEKITGTLPAGHIEKRHIVEFRDARMAEGIKGATVQKQLNLLRPIFGCAVNDGIIKANPLDGVKAPKSKGGGDKARIPFALDDLRALFTSGPYANPATRRDDREQAQFWVPLLALWTGARQSELVQLLTKDIGSEGGIPFIHITDGEGKTVKTANSKRRIPVHRELIACGFLEFVNGMRRTGAERLFPAFASAEGRATGASFSQWFTRYRREAGITDRRKVFHSFRHGFKDACRTCGISAEHHDRITGHGSRSVGDGYGGGEFPLPPLREAMERLRYDGLDLSHLHRPNPAAKIL